MKRIAFSLLFIGLSVGAVFATSAYFSDAETSNDNTFAAGSIDLNVDGGNTNVVKFTVANMRPGNQPIGTWKLKNVGTVNGYVDLENVVVTNQENECLEPEMEAGDATCDNPGVGQGELQNVVSLSKLFWDNDCDGWVGLGETAIFDGKVGTLPSHFETNRSLAAGASQCVTAQFNWWNTPDDNKAMNDSMDLGMTFELGQDATQ